MRVTRAASASAAIIRLPHEQMPNAYLDRFIELEHFFVRKVMLVKYSSAFVVLPGGFGTLDEAFEVVTLIQTGKLESFPIVAMGNTYWYELRDFVEKAMLTAGTVNDDDVEIIELADTVDQAMEIIRRCV